MENGGTTLTERIALMVQKDTELMDTKRAFGLARRDKAALAPDISRCRWSAACSVSRACTTLGYTRHAKTE